MAGGLEQDDLSGPFQLKLFYDSVIKYIHINAYRYNFFIN